MLTAVRARLARALARGYGPVAGERSATEAPLADTALVAPSEHDLLPTLGGGCGDPLCAECESDADADERLSAVDQESVVRTYACGEFAMPLASLLEEEEIGAAHRRCSCACACDFRRAARDASDTLRVIVIHAVNNPPSLQTVALLLVLVLVPAAAAVLCLLLVYLWWLWAGSAVR